MSDQSAQWIFSTSITRSNLNIFRLFLKHWIQLNQSYNYAFQSMYDSQCALINSSREKVTAARSINQRTRWAFFFPLAATLQSSRISQMRREQIIISKQLYNLSSKSFENSKTNLIRLYCENKWILSLILRCALAR